MIKTGLEDFEKEIDGGDLFTGLVTKETKKVLRDIDLNTALSLIVLNNFNVAVWENKHKYNGIQEPFLLIISMKTEEGFTGHSFICCGLTFEEAHLVKDIIKSKMEVKNE